MARAEYMVQTDEPSSEECWKAVIIENRTEFRNVTCASGYEKIVSCNVGYHGTSRIIETRQMTMNAVFYGHQFIRL
jgi:hypothetical protein